MSLPKTYTELLHPLIAFRSISTDPAYKGECRATAEWLAAEFKKRGFVSEIIEARTTNPFVHAYYEVDPSLPTVLVYGHYDVQPANAEGWHNGDPFSVHEKGGRLFARGVMDNKGQVLVHIATVFDLIAENKLAYNVRFFIEGDEESGSPDIEYILKKHKSALACDYVFVSDGPMPVDGQPVYDATFRMAANIRVQLTTGKNDLHSGLYGGAVPNAGLELSRLLSGMVDTNNMITIPGFYKGIWAPKAELLATANRTQPDKKAQSSAGVKKLLTHKKYAFGSQTAFLPSLEISGVHTGYTGTGFQNIVPHTADARINIRIAPGQTTKHVCGALEAYIRKHTPAYATVRIEKELYGDPIVVDVNNEYAENARKVAQKVYGKKPMPLYCGATIPIVGLFQTILKRPVVSMGLVNPDCNIHGVNENFKVAAIAKGCSFSRSLFGVR